MSCYRKSGRRHVLRCTAGSALAKGDIVQSTEATGSRTVDNAASNAPVLGNAQAAAASGAEVLVDVLHPGDEVWVTIASGTMDATYVLKFADISDETGITLTATNNDFRVLGWDGKTTNECFGTFTTLEMASVTAAI